jgi:hypothetical protein
MGMNIHTNQSMSGRRSFRYLESRYANELLQKGNLLVTTLHECRRKEAALRDRVRGDAGEGKSTAMSLIDNVTWRTDTDVPKHLRKVFKTNPSFPVTIRSNIVEQHTDCEDYYILCLSAVFGLRIKKAFNVDACVEITNTDEFFRQICSVIPATEASVGPIQYLPRDFVYVQDGDQIYQSTTRWSQIHPAWKKDCRYEYQREIRCLWTPADRPIQPVVVRIPDPRAVLKPRLNCNF